MKTLAVLALQGAFIEHEKMFESLGAKCFEIRKKEDLEKPFDALVLPGGESTVQGKLLKELGLFDVLQKKIQEGLPVFATCAGLILLAQDIENDSKKWFATLPVSVERNAYGRQLGSFIANEEFKGLGKVSENFIRAPAISKTSESVEILSSFGGKATAVRYKNQFALAFHPEVGNDPRIHKMFLDSIKVPVESVAIAV